LQTIEVGLKDEIGAANYITPQSVLAATKLVKIGQTHPLGIVVEPGMPAFQKWLGLFEQIYPDG